MISILNSFKQLRWSFVRKYNKLPLGVKRFDETEQLSSVIESHEAQQPKDWDSLKDNVLKLSRRYTTSNIDSFIVGAFISLKKYDSALNYVDHLKQSDGLSLAIIGKLFRLYYHMCMDCGVTDDKERQIFALYETVRKSYPLLDSITNESIIMALSLTTHWKICLQALEESKISCVPSQAAYGHTVIAAFKHHEDDLAWSLLEEMMAKNRTPYEECFLTYVKSSKTLPENKTLQNIEKLLHFFGDNDVTCTNNVALILKDMFEKFEAQARFTRVTNSGVCLGCKNKLPRFTLKDSEFEELKRVFMQRVIIGKDVFRKTTPTELERFQEFVAKNVKYDVIIDGLNVAYTAGTNKPLHLIANMVTSVVRHFAEQKKSVLVLGRNHMQRWPPKYLSFIQKNADMFLTQNLSQDDPYLLYCALNSGMQTIIVTKDLMRGHLFLLKDPEHKRLFSRWLSQCLHPLSSVYDDGRVIFKPPLPFIKAAQKHRGSWHIPFVNSDNKESWLCVKL